jgi:hypothetical protein
MCRRSHSGVQHHDYFFSGAQRLCDTSLLLNVLNLSVWLMLLISKPVLDLLGLQVLLKYFLLFKHLHPYYSHTWVRIAAFRRECVHAGSGMLH